MVRTTAVEPGRTRRTASSPDPAALEAALETNDLRVTAPRRAVMQLIAGRGAGHFTAADLLADARARRIDVGRATVFRTLDLLLDVALVERIELPDGEHAYVACQTSHHHHVICTGCGRSTDVGDHDLRSMTAAVERATGYAIDGHRLELFGRCPSCLGDADDDAT
jgi:Fur family ferric uptake transcriptional regulator